MHLHAAEQDQIAVTACADKLLRCTPVGMGQQTAGDEQARPASVPPPGGQGVPTSLAQLLAMPMGRVVSTSLPLPGSGSPRAQPHAFGSARSAPPACGILNTLFVPDASGQAVLAPHALSPGMRSALLAALAAPSGLPQSWFGAQPPTIL